MDLYGRARVLGVRQRGDNGCGYWTNDQGERVDFTTKLVDVYDPHTGPDNLFAPVEMEIPTDGAEYLFRVSLRGKPKMRGAYADVEATIVEIKPVGAAGVTPSPAAPVDKPQAVKTA